MVVEQRRALDGFAVRRTPPANLVPEDEALFRHELVRSFGPTDVFRLRDVGLTADGVFVSGLRAVEELRYVPQERMGTRYVVRNLLRRRSRFADPGWRYVTAFNRWSPGNYFHWMCDVLPRVLLVREEVAGATFVLPSSHAVPFVEDSLAPFRPAAIEYFPGDRLATFREVVVPGHIALTGNYHEPTMRELASFLRRSLAGAAAPEPAGRLLYATRRRAQHRFVLNEDDVVALLDRYGFEVVENETLGLAEQIALHGQAKALVGVMGANLTNVMFMPPGSSLLQLTRRGDASNHLYYALADAVGARFYYQQCDAVDAGWGIRWNVTVDLDELARNVEAMIADRF